MNITSGIDKDKISYIRSTRAKRIRITLRPDCSITVTVPPHGTLAEAQKFLESKADWLQKHLLKMEQHQQTRQDQEEKENVDLNQAQDALFDRLEFFSKQYNLPYRRATFRCQKTLWGSCSGPNNINLNINLAFLPSHLQDYVLLHELTHLKIKNHSRAFWDQLDRYCQGRARELAKELKQHRLKL
jgi:hypothetical protein